MTAILLLSGLAGFILFCGGAFVFLIGLLPGVARSWPSVPRIAGFTALAGFALFAGALLLLSLQPTKPRSTPRMQGAAGGARPRDAGSQSRPVRVAARSEHDA